MSSNFQLLVTFKEKEDGARQGMEVEAGGRGQGRGLKVEGFELSN